jgi:hypothetical protein
LFGRQLVLGKKFEDATGREPFRAQALLGFTPGCERYDDGGCSGRENIKHRIIPGLTNRDTAAPQHLRKVRPIPFEDDSVGQTGGECREFRFGQIGTGKQAPS